MEAALKYIFGAAISLVIAYASYAERLGITANFLAQSVAFYIACAGVVLGLGLYRVTEKRPVYDDPEVYIVLVPIVLACTFAIGMFHMSPTRITVVGMVTVVASMGVSYLLRKNKFIR